MLFEKKWKLMNDSNDSKNIIKLFNDHDRMDYNIDTDDTYFDFGSWQYNKKKISFTQ